MLLLNKNIRACVFDAFGTLFNLDIPSEKIDQLTEGKGKELLAIWRRKQLEYTWLRGLMDNHVPFDQVTRHALTFAMESVGTESMELYDILMPIYKKAIAFPEIKPMLEHLQSAEIKTAILSNGSPDMLHAGTKNAGIDHLIDHIFSVESVGVFKPSPKVYQLALDGLSLKKEELLFFSSNQWDVAGATHFGLETVWVNKYNQVPEQLERQAKYVIRDLGMIEC